MPLLGVINNPKLCTSLQQKAWPSIFEGHNLALSVMQGCQGTFFPNFDAIRPQDRHLPGRIRQHRQLCGAILPSRFRASASLSRKNYQCLMQGLFEHDGIHSDMSTTGQAVPESCDLS